MSGDQSPPECSEALEEAKTAAPAVRWVGAEHAAAVVEAWAAVGRWAAVAAGVAQAVLLLAARIWLSQAIFVHQIMMMMRAEGFSETPPVADTLIRSLAPLLLATGLATRPVALLLLLGAGQGLFRTPLAGAQAVLLIWLLIGGAGPLSLDFPLRSGLARVPVWAVRAISQLYAASDTLGDRCCRLERGSFLRPPSPEGPAWRCGQCPSPASWSRHPWSLLLLCWALLLGVATRPVALILCALAPPIVLSGRCLRSI